MEILNLIPLIYSKLAAFILIFTRISALFTTFVLFRSSIVSSRIIIALSTVLSVYILLSTNYHLTDKNIFSINSFTSILFQFLIGFITGLILNIAFEIFSAVGQVISSQIGLSMASLIDPMLGNLTTLTQFYMFSIMIIFLMMDGHISVITFMLDSFNVFPVDHYFLPKNLINDVLTYSGVIFTASIQLSITIVIAILLTNLSMSVMAKFAPQFNIFSMGVGLTIIVGLIYLYLTFGFFADKAGYFIEQSIRLLHKELVMTSYGT